MAGTLKQTAPGMTQAAVLRDPATPQGIGQFAIIQSMAQPLSVEVIPINVGNATEIARAIDAFARESNSGLIVTPRPWTAAHRELIVTLAARHKLPAVYGARYFVADGGLTRMDLTMSISSGARLLMSIGFSRARDQPTCEATLVVDENSFSWTPARGIV